MRRDALGVVRDLHTSGVPVNSATAFGRVAFGSTAG